MKQHGTDRFTRVFYQNNYLFFFLQILDYVPAAALREFIDFFATLLIVAKKCCKDFEKPGKCCKVNVARILAILKMLQNSCCKDFENSCNINFSNVAKKKTYGSSAGYTPRAQSASLMLMARKTKKPKRPQHPKE